MSFEKKKLLFICGLVLGIVIRLLGTAITSNNWPGFFISTCHILAVAVGCQLALRSPTSRET